jgi:hypothetical protein
MQYDFGRLHNDASPSLFWKTGKNKRTVGISPYIEALIRYKKMKSGVSIAEKLQ